MKTVAISDLHGTLPNIEEAEVLFICGDISPLDIQFNKPRMQEWLHTQFIPWINGLPVEKVFLVAGNHDAWFEGASYCQIAELKRLSLCKLEYLCNELTTYIDNEGNEWSIFGTPYCKVFGNWPFMRTDSYLEERFKEIPKDVDFIISHDTPYGVGQQDQILEKARWNHSELDHVGNIPLRNRLESIDFRWLFHGHIHSSSHDPEPFGNGWVVNVSILDESYTENFAPLELTHL